MHHSSGPLMSVQSSHLPADSVRGGYDHSITATSLGSGLTGVLMFGGQLKLGGAPIADLETTILRLVRE